MCPQLASIMALHGKSLQRHFSHFETYEINHLYRGIIAWLLQQSQLNDAHQFINGSKRPPVNDERMDTLEMLASDPFSPVDCANGYKTHTLISAYLLMLM